MPKVKTNSLLKEYAGIPATLEVAGNTVRECLDDLIKQHPEADNWLYGQYGYMRVIISINNAETITMDKDSLNRSLKSDDELMIFAVVSGG
jgi:molybdopterin converting factor small subunit